MSLQDLFPAVVALLGVIVGGLIAELRTWLQGARERRQALSKLLYELLELRFRITRSDPESAIEALKRILSGHAVGAAASSEISQAQAAFRIALPLLKKSLIKTNSTEYAAMVSAVAPFDPVLAYYLRGQERLAELESKIQECYGKISEMPQIASEPQFLASRDVVESATVRALTKRVLKGLTRDCQQVARRISWRTARRVRKVIEKQDNLDETVFESMVSDLLQSVQSQLKVNPSDGSSKS